MNIVLYFTCVDCSLIVTISLIAFINKINNKILIAFNNISLLIPYEYRAIIHMS
jgi:hypothetical protein